MPRESSAWFRFSLLNALLVILAVACGLGAYRWGQQQGRDSQLAQLKLARGGFPTSTAAKPQFARSTLTMQDVSQQFALEVGMPCQEVTRWFRAQDHTGIAMEDYAADPKQGHRYIIGLADGTLTLFADPDGNVRYWCFGEKGFDLR